jgi:iron-sulfur cluster assembly accessory protein
MAHEHEKAEMQTSGIVTKEMTIGEVVQKYPQAVEIMLRHGLHCVGCHISPYESIEAGAKVYGIDEKTLSTMLSEINESVKQMPTLDFKGVTLTEKAAAQLKKLAEAEEKQGHGVRLFVVHGGCSGYSYGMEFEEKPRENDETFEQHGVKVFLDNDSKPMLNGVLIDYRETLESSGFVMRNPNAKSSCGCGSSFQA